jgi:streptogramin lyase
MVRRLAMQAAVLVALPSRRSASRPGMRRRQMPGSVKTYPGICVPQGIAAGPDGAMWFTNSINNTNRADEHGGSAHGLRRDRDQ